MKMLRKFLVALLIVSSIFTTGCDASKIMEVITKVAEGIQKVVPVVKEVIDTISGATNNDNNNTNTATNTNTDTAADTDNNNDGVIVVDPTDNEDVGQNGNNNGNNTAGTDQSVEDLIQSANSVLPYDRVGTVSTAAGASEIKSKYGITLLDGKAWREQFETGTASKWSAAKIAQLDQILSKIPANFRKCTSGFSMQGKITANDDGTEIGGLGGDPIILSEGSTNTSEDFHHLVAHEMTHEFQRKNANMCRQWAAQFWNNGQPKKSSITDYGNTNFMEDMAECVAEYFKNPEKLRQHDPERYEFVKNNIWK
ncbi:MAG: hypothetical protein ACOYXC_13035 [Candidatus Rifleibacteriota bacterium]